MSKQSEQLKEALALAEKLNAQKKAGNKLDLESEPALISLNGLLQSSVKIRENELTLLKRRLVLAKEAADSDDKRDASERKSIERQATLIADTEELIKIQKSGAIKSLQANKEITSEIDKAIRQKRQAMAEEYREEKKKHKAIKDVVSSREDEFEITKAIGGLMSMAGAVGALGADLLSKSLDILTARMFGFNISLNNVLGGIETLPTEIESSVASMVKNTGLSLTSLQTSLITAFDPSGAQFAIGGMRKQFQALAKEGVDVGSMIERSLSLNEVQGAFTTLIQQSALFRQDFLDGSPATASYIANLVAGLERVGVANADSAEIFDLYNKAMTNSPAESGAALLSLASISKSLGIETSKSFSNFKSVMGPLSQFGSRMTGVFAKLQARAAATGTSLSKLSGIAEGMDTFEGAAKAAQTLNGILGDTFINVTDLALAEPDEKIKMITDAIKDSGVEFDSLNRQYKKIISTAAGFDSVGEFQRQLFNEEEINRSTASLDLKAMSMKKLNSLIVDGLNVTEKQQRAVSAFGAASATSMDVARKGAKEYSEGMGLLMKETAQKTKDPAAAFMSAFMAMNAAAKGEELVGAQTAAKGVTNLAAKAGAAVFIGSTAKQLYDKAQNEGIQNALSTGTPMKLGSAGAPQAQATTVERMQLVDIDPEKGMAMIKWAEKIVDKRLERAAAKARE